MKKIGLVIFALGFGFIVYFKFNSHVDAALVKVTLSPLEKSKPLKQTVNLEKKVGSDALQRGNENKNISLVTKPNVVHSLDDKLTPADYQSADYQSAEEYFQTMKQTYAGWDDDSIKVEIKQIDGDIQSYQLIERANNQELSSDDIIYLSHLLSSRDAAHSVLAERSLNKIQEKMDKLQASLKG